MNERREGRRYDIGPPIGGGGMGVVHRARDRLFDRPVALKFLRHEDPVTVERLLREARAQARVQHENVARVYDAGMLDGGPFIAMQLIEGESLASLGPRLSFAEQAKILHDVALAIHAAHRVGLIHRDLKPSNILVSRIEAALRPYVIDFGLARVVDGGGLTLSGQVVGTPAYMAPEQALGRTREIDRRTDVYALGATLYELLTGHPPFRGTDFSKLLEQIVDRPPVAPRKLRKDVPRDLETIALRCLRKEPPQRYDSARAVAEDLARYLRGERVEARTTGFRYVARRAARRHRAALVVATVGLAATLAIGFAVRLSPRWEREGRQEVLLSTARACLEKARRQRLAAEERESVALSAFDRGARAEGEAAWREAREKLEPIDRQYAAAARGCEAALEVDREHAGARALLADVLFERATWAESRRRETERAALVQRLELYDDGSRLATLNAPTVLRLEVAPEDATLELSRYVTEPSGRIVEGPRQPVARQAFASLALPRGAYLLRLRAKGRVPVRLPLLATRGRELELRFELPRDERVPPGFVYVPAGPFLTGVLDEGLRLGLGQVPLHEVRTAAFLIARFETTLGEWIEFLEAQPEEERRRRLPKAERPLADAVALEPLGAGLWRYTFRPAPGRVYAATTGEPILFGRRSRRVAQDWRRFPVTGISAEDAAAYAAWLARTERVPRARLCAPYEWERAARGADGRPFPHGHRLAPDDANIDVTYDRDDWGPDEVGAHPRSQSPFGLHDAAGNAFEWLQLVPGTRVASTRSAGYNFNVGMNDLANPNDFPADARETSFGTRICADAP